VLPLEEAQRTAQWYERVHSAQLALLGGQSHRTFDKVTLAGTDINAWEPRPDASMHVLQYLRGAAGQSDIISVQGYNFEKFLGPEFPVSEILPLQLGTGSGAAVINDPWVAVGLVISIDPNGYVVTFQAPGQ